jgi:molybdopterin-containing oxidoreductase family iron-sulfur binding subunit
MKRQPYPKFDSPDGKRWWQSLRELEGSPELQAELVREFPDGAAEPPDGVSRRTFFRLAGASFAMAGLAACRRPDERILPYAKAPEEVVPGNPLFFATAIPWNGTALGVLVESHEGRPTKIEGNPRHPESQGATNTFVQAEVLNLWDIDRSDAPANKGQNRDWDTAASTLAALGRKAKDNRGQGLAILTEAHRSPTTARLLAKVKEAMPGAMIVRWDPWARDHAKIGAELAFGKRAETIYDLSKARTVVALDADFLTHDAGGAVRHARALAQGRSRLTPGDMIRLYSVESAHTVTGAMADHRVRLAARQVPAFTYALARAVGVAGAPAAPLDAEAGRAAEVVAKDLQQNKGKGLVIVGDKQPPAVHAFAHLINLALGNVGQTVSYVPCFDDAVEGPRGITALGRAMDAGQVSTLLILGGNPAFDAPADAGFADALAKVDAVVHLSPYRDETSMVASLHIPRAHALESWGDVRAQDGTLSVVQPLIAPLYQGRTDAELLSIFLGAPEKAYDLVRGTLKAGAGKDFDKAWRRALHDGVWAGSEHPRIEVSENRGQLLGAAAADAAQQATGVELTFTPDPHTWDGRFANNPWLQELPDPMAKLTWGNAAYISPATAKRLGVANGDVVDLGENVVVPVLVMPGQADESLALTFGQGRRGGRVADGVGVSVARLRTSSAFFIGAAAKLVKVPGATESLARTQEHFNMEHRAPVREGTLADYAKDPGSARKVEEQEHRSPLLSLYPDYEYNGRKWALAIDLNTCTGCNACVVACVSENNILQVGADGVRLSREMHWIRIDRYFEGDAGNPRSVTQPMTCQQCENAPCEQVCPVQATSHSPEGLNDMAYNRCIGTKYCLNNCPFKVRRFNYFHYARRDPNDSETRKAQYNPDVTVRYRGVMEKCTYCVQRINAAKIAAHRAGTEEIKDGTIVTACQQACPPQALTFGDLNDPKSKVARLRSDPRSYVLLEEINVRPRTTYLARIHNPNPDMDMEGAR